MFAGLLAVHVVIAIALVVLVLLNQGKGADMGAAFGSGASSTVFGSQGAASFMTKLIASLGATFFLTSLGLAVLASQGGGSGDQSSVIDKAPASDGPEAPAERRDPEAPAAPEQPAGADGGAAPAAPEQPTDEGGAAPATPQERGDSGEGSPEQPADTAGEPGSE